MYHSSFLVLSYRNRHLICCHWSNVKENNKKNEIESRLKNNNYINSRNQIRPKSGMNSFSQKTNSFLDKSKSVIIKCFIQEGIRLWREGIHTEFWSDLIPRINILYYPLSKHPTKLKKILSFAFLIFFSKMILS